MAVERIDYASDSDYEMAMQMEAQEAEARADYEFWQEHDVCPICGDVKHRSDLHKICGN